MQANRKYLNQAHDILNAFANGADAVYRGAQSIVTAARTAITRNWLVRYLATDLTGPLRVDIAVFQRLENLAYDFQRSLK